MSRAPIPLTGEESQIEAVEAHSQFHWKKLNMSDILLQNVRDAQNKDPILKHLKDLTVYIQVQDLSKRNFQ